MPNPEPDIDDTIRTAWNKSAPYSQWITELGGDHAIVVDDTDRSLYRVPVLVGDAVEFGVPEPVDPQASSSEERTVFASRAESRPDVAAGIDGDEVTAHLRGRHDQAKHGNRFRTPGDRSSGLRREGVARTPKSRDRADSNSGSETRPAGREFSGRELRDILDDKDGTVTEHLRTLQEAGATREQAATALRGLGVDVDDEVDPVLSQNSYDRVNFSSWSGPARELRTRAEAEERAEAEAVRQRALREVTPSAYARLLGEDGQPALVKSRPVRAVVEAMRERGWTLTNATRFGQYTWSSPDGSSRLHMSTAGSGPPTLYDDGWNTISGRKALQRVTGVAASDGQKDAPDESDTEPASSTFVDLVPDFWPVLDELDARLTQHPSLGEDVEPAPPIEAPTTSEPPAAEPDQPSDPKEGEDPVSTLSTDVRTRLGLPEDADDAAVLAAIDDVKVKADNPQPDPEQVAASVAAKAEADELRKEVTVLASQVETMSAKLAAAEQEKVATVKASVLDDAVKQGKIRPAEREQWAKDYDEAPGAITRVLASLAPGTAVPVMASGETTNPDVGVDLDAEWQQVSHLFPAETVKEG